MPTIYRKTAKGHAEMATRAHRLAPRLRQMLIVVDGHRSDDDLRRMIAQQADEALRALVDGGFIEAISTRAPAPARPAAAAAVAPSAAAPSASAPAGAGTRAGFGEQFKRDAVRTLTDQLGPMAESLAMRIEKARDADELRPLLEQGHRYLRELRGSFAATAFADRFLADRATA